MADTARNMTLYRRRSRRNSIYMSLSLVSSVIGMGWLAIILGTLVVGCE